MLDRNDPVTVPTCPSCEGPMAVRKPRKGGDSFWGCRGYPDCRGTRDIDSDSHDSPGDGATEPPAQVRVPWYDATLDRAGWQCRYTTAGGRLRSSPSLMPISNEFRQCWIAGTRVTHPAPDRVRRVTGAIKKLIQRGSNPPIHPEAELEILKSLGLGGNVRRSALQGDLSVRLEPDVFRALSGHGPGLHGLDFEPDAQVQFDSDHELRFVLGWVPENLGPAAPRWFVPQASFDDLTAALGDYGPSGRRVDFLVSAPFGTPFVVEIDGPQHGDSAGPDGERDQMLASVGIEVVRIPTSEIDRGRGDSLERVKALWARPPQVADKTIADASLLPPSIHRLAIALLDGVDAGFLKGSTWSVRLEGDPDMAPSMIWPYVRLFGAMDRLWGSFVMPKEILLGTERGWTRMETMASRRPMPCGPKQPHLIIRLQPHLTAFDRLGPPNEEIPEIVVRSARLPVVVGDDLFEPAVRVGLEGVDPADVEMALTEVLQAIFAKEGFREGQIEALVEIMEGRDCTVLLPTGGGKSLIYQMAGLCKPGRTIVIDPLIALIEDQQRGLAEHGIDKVVGFSSFLVGQGRLDTLLRQVESGDALFIFVAPERFQHRRFRNSIRSLAQVAPINLAVVDEAHCVSEWGHQFRTSYLTLGRVLRDVCRDTLGSSPPLLALTGTASRAVLKDVLTQLGISTGSANSIVRPASFDRPELEMATSQSSPDDSLPVLTGSLRVLPSRFGVPATEFFRPRAGRTYSGLIFCPHVSGDHGIIELQRTAARVVGFEPAIYSGSSPKESGRSIYKSRDWECKKRESAESFKDNRVPLMVTTNAFGMGIDKPNIRYVLHYGMPASIEAYYQEVGRAGRDKERAICLLIWNERDRARSDRLTITGSSLEAVRRECASLRGSDSDSITQQLYFLLDTFKGAEVELAEVERVVDDDGFLPNLGHGRTTELAKGTDDEASRRERAIYRLMLLGVVDDYLVESSFVVRLASVSPGDVAGALSGFVERTDPGAQRPSVAQFAAQASGMTLREAVSWAARELIDFIYEIIVESRRRSLREMYAAVRDASSQGDGFRGRVLDYLTRGDISRVLDDLVEAAALDYAAWEGALARLEGVDDANELRGGCSRMLGSNPFHAGLLFGRAYSEIIHPAGNLQDFAANLERSLTSARERYRVPESELEAFTGRLLTSLETDSSDGLSLALDVASRLGLAAETTARIEYRAMCDPGSDPGVRVVALADRLAQISKELESAVGSVKHAG